MPHPEDDISNNQESAPVSLRDAISANMDASEAGSLNAPADAPQLDLAPADDIAARVRDEGGRFAPKDKEQAAPVAQPAPAVAAPAADQQAATLTTWRKEYIPIQQKLAAGLPLSADEAKKLADYNVQREREYSTGISTYKAEAQNAKQITDAMVDFMPLLQQNNINPAQWISNLGNAHRTLAMGTPEQKMQMFARLAQDYGIPLAAVGQAAAGQLDPAVAALMAELDHVKKSVGSVTQYHQQQQDNAMKQELAKFQDASKYPHFERALPTMIQLLESGLVDDPEAAYAKAVRMDDTIWETEQQRQAQAQAGQTAASKAAAAARARQAGGQVRTGAPLGTTTARPQSNDLRGSIESAFDEHVTGGRV